MIRAEYAHEHYIVDIDLAPITEDPRSHYGIPVLTVTTHRSRGREDNVSPLVADILDGATVHALGAVVLTDGDCVAVRRMLGLPADDHHVVPCYDAVRQVGSVHGGGYSYTVTGKWGGSASGQCTWMLHPTEGVICALGGMDYARTMDELRAKTGADVSVGCYLDTPDEVRAAILAAGWPIPDATQAVARERDAAADARIIAKLNADREAREGGQLTDETMPSAVAPTIETHHLVAMVHGKPVVPIRIKSEGFGGATDMEGDPIEAVLRKQGAEIHYIAPAIGGGYVGTMAGPLEEICYTLAGARWYLYVATTSGGDTWCQEWWVSTARLTADVAADTIVACRERAYKRGE